MTHEYTNGKPYSKSRIFESLLKEDSLDDYDTNDEVRNKNAAALKDSELQRAISNFKHDTLEAVTETIRPLVDDEKYNAKYSIGCSSFGGAVRPGATFEIVVKFTANKKMKIETDLDYYNEMKARDTFLQDFVKKLKPELMDLAARNCPVQIRGITTKVVEPSDMIDRDCIMKVEIPVKIDEDVLNDFYLS